MEAVDQEKLKQIPTEKEKEGEPKDEFEEKEDVAEDEPVTPTLQRRPSLEDVLLTGLERGTVGLARTLKKKQEEEVWAVIENMDVSNFHELVPEMALEYPFDLDIFQKQAVYHLENNESVFVAAHTSAGKTVVAEYAIALAAKHMTRTIYTSPIKALSNQKFRDFRETFGDVGLITGDVSIRPEAACLIVTTEILRSMLYKGADLIRDVEWVIFDEVHYVNDLERGVVWEEVIIMLPDHVNLILLSATVPNTFEFADWIGRTKKKNIYVISTSKRPVPLEHYLYVNDELHKIVDSRGRYMSEGYQAALNSIKEQQAKEGHLPKQQFALTKTRQQRSRWMRMINMLKQKALLPVVVFAFSKKRCEELAYSLTTVDLTTAQEKHYTHIFMEQSLSRLKGSDRRLPQVMRIKDLLKRGIGVHHGGLLPIVKEMVEILFSRGRVKVLFATETFAMGVNMPARTVVYENTRKHDGRAFRDLYPGEYTQMSGRAGRRGLDTVGIVIINIKDDQLPENSDLHKMLLGKPQELESRFRLTYTMILNLLRVQEFKVEDMMKRSFSEFNTQRTVPQQEKMLQQCEKEVMELQGQKMEAINRNPDIEEYFATCREKQHLDAELQRMVMSSRQAIQTLTTGRVVRVKTPSSPQNGCLAVILKSLAKNTYFTDSFAGDGKEDRQFHAVVLENKGTASVSKIDTSDITELYSMRLKDVDPSRFIPFTDQNALRTLAQQLGKLQGGKGGKGGRLEVLHPIKDLKINDFEFVDFYTRRESIAERVERFDCRRSPTLKQDYAVLEREDELIHQIQKARLALSNESLHLMPEFQQRIAVLGTLYYIDHNNTVLLKGRVARELNTVRDELIATELIFNNTLTDLPPEAIVALLSALIFELKTEVELKLPEMLVQARKEMEDLAEHLLLIQQECGLVLDPRDYLKNLNFGLMEVVFEWARGMPFADICKLTDVPEGSVVRSIVRLDETCREVRNAARIIGNSVLYAKMEKASAMIKRDIVFASSLYYDK
ncbi:Helicase SKI2W, variant 2 [Balamuthia mandrillaris]